MPSTADNVLSFINFADMKPESMGLIFV
jgi:hypothetical protein